MERLAAEAHYSALHADAQYHDGSFTNWHSERSRAFPYHFSDGVHVDVALADVAPWDDFTVRRSASPTPPDDQQ